MIHLHLIMIHLQVIGDKQSINDQMKSDITLSLIDCTLILTHYRGVTLTLADLNYVILACRLPQLKP